MSLNKQFAHSALNIAAEIMGNVPENVMLEMLQRKINLYLDKKLTRTALVVALTLVSVKLEPKLIENEEDNNISNHPDEFINDPFL